MRELLPAKPPHVPARSGAATSGEQDKMRTLISDAPGFQDLRLQCPRCRSNIDQLNCSSCGLTMPVDDGIINALPPERAAYFARFIGDYEHIRAAEGRWSPEDDFYLSLPHKDVSGRN